MASWIFNERNLGDDEIVTKKLLYVGIFCAQFSLNLEENLSDWNFCQRIIQSLR